MIHEEGNFQNKHAILGESGEYYWTWDVPDDNLGIRNVLGPVLTAQELEELQADHE